LSFKFRSTVDVNKVSGALFNTTIAVGYSDEMHWSGKPACVLAQELEEGNDNIPARPHLHEGLMYGRDEIRAAIREFASGIVGHRSAAGAQKVADAARQAVIDYVYSGELEPNTAYTIAKKLSDQPLVQTGELLHLLEAVVIKGRI
jgi:hypothetical protein